MIPLPNSGAALVCFAVEAEARPFRSWAARQQRVQVLVTGMGPVNAQRGIAEALAGNRPSFVLTCGFAGGLDPELKCGDIVFDEHTCPGVTRFLKVRGGRKAQFHCAPCIAVTEREKSALRQRTRMDAVEMESGVICAACDAAGIPVAVVRVVSDAAAEDLPLDFNRLVDSGQNLVMRKLLPALAKSPGKIPELVRFGRRTTAAAAKLAETLKGLLSSEIRPRLPGAN